jgi:hypothetical protein
MKEQEQKNGAKMNKVDKKKRKKKKKQSNKTSHEVHNIGYYKHQGSQNVWEKQKSPPL